MQVDLPRRLAGEALGTALLVAAVVGSGIMAAKLTHDTALALLCNTLATGGALVALILAFGGISGAHFNPVVSLVMAWRKQMSPRDAALYALAQIAGGIAGSIVANVMFDLPAVAWSQTARHGGAQLFSEAVATFGLVGVVLAVAAPRAPFAVAAYIVAAYWFTASTSFANPAVTIARAFSDTFAGIAPADIAGFCGAQLVGGALAAVIFSWLKPAEIVPE